MVRSLLIPVLTVASFMPVAMAQDGYVPVTPAIYHPGADHQSNVTNVDYSRRRASYAHRRRRHKAIKRIGIGAAGGAAIGALAGGGKGAAIGGIAGAGAGALYNDYQNRHGR